MAINPKRELFVWGPIEGVLHYPWYFCIAIVKMFPKVYGVHWPAILFSFTDHKMTFICEYEALRRAGWEVAKRWVLPRANYARVRFRYDRAVGKLQVCNQEVEHRLSSRGRAERGRGDLTGLPRRFAPRNDIAELYRQWKKVYLDFWLHGLVPEVANWGQEKFLMDALVRHGLRGQEYLHALEVLSAPSGIGFFQEAERDLLKIVLHAQEIATPRHAVGARNDTVKNMLAKHAQKYFWLHNSYFGTKVLTTRDFERMLREELKKGNIVKRIRDIAQSPIRRAQAKEQMIRKLKLTPLEARVAQVLGDTVSWQDERKKYIWQAGHVVDLFLHEAARRAKVPFELCKDLLPEELEQILAGKKLNVRSIVRQRRASAGCLKGDRLSLVVGAKAQTLMAPFQKRAVSGVAEVSGLVVSRGPTVRGTVRLIFSPQKEQARMKQGDVLVTSMTSPDYIVVMKRAGAIVTDEGGMTSHAAVVSRELGVLCIVGTKIATQVFKDGDIVKVDAARSIVRKI